MNWGKVVGSTGRLKLKIRKWKHNQTGEEMEGNEVQSYYPKEAPTQSLGTYQAPQQQPTYQTPPSYQQPAQPNTQYQAPSVNQQPPVQGGYQPGQF